MKYMKKVLAIFAASLAVLSLTVSASAASTEAETETGLKPFSAGSLNICALKGPTAMGMIKYMNDADTGALTDYSYDFRIVSAVDEVTPQLIQGNVDIAAVPANLASVLYNKTEGGIKVLAINTLGVLYICEMGDSLNSIEDLKGKTIFASGKGATPEYALSYILRENGIDPEKDLTIEWKSEHTECLTSLISSADGAALLPQPFVTAAQQKNDQVRAALDLTAEWDRIQEGKENGSSMLTGVVVARTAFLDEHPDVAEAFLDHYKESVDFVNENVEEAAKLIGQYDIVAEDVAVKALPACNIVCITADEMKQKLSGYLQVLNDQNPQAVGGALPQDDFYYGAE
jgi:NitT/TauT family transport system substrate-binding protein